MSSAKITMFSCVNPAEIKLATEHLEANRRMACNVVSDAVVIPMPSVEEFNKWFVGGLRSEKLDATGYDFIINVEPDASVANPEAWDDRFTKYDYMGAPWPASWKRLRHYAHSHGEVPENVLVGNSGFCMMSRKFVQTLRKLSNEFQGYSFDRDGGCDFYLCIAKARTLRKDGVRIPEPSVASRFSVERSPYLGSFGVHNWVSVHGRQVSLKENRFKLFKDLVK